MFDYFHSNENEQYLFLQMPLMLIKDEQFKKISDGAKILYSLLLNRTSLSVKNGWTDTEGRVYIIYTIEEITKDLNCWEQKATKTMKELREIGLIKSVRQGLGKPNIIYVMNFATALKYQPKDKKEPINPVKSMICDFHKSGIVKITNQEPVNITIQELPESQSIYIDLKKTYSNDIESESSQSQMANLTSITDMTLTNDIDTDLTTRSNAFEMKKGLPQPATPTKANGLKSPFIKTSIIDDYTTYRKIIQDNIGYCYFLENRHTDIDLLDEIVNCVLDVICTKGDTVKISGEDKSRNMVINQYLKLNASDIEHVLERYREQRHKITYINSYLKTMLYTVRQESGHFYTNAVRADGVVY